MTEGEESKPVKSVYFMTSYFMDSPLSVRTLYFKQSLTSPLVQLYTTANGSFMLSLTIIWLAYLENWNTQKCPYWFNHPLPPHRTGLTHIIIPPWSLKNDQTKPIHLILCHDCVNLRPWRKMAAQDTTLDLTSLLLTSEFWNQSSLPSTTSAKRR